MRRWAVTVFSAGVLVGAATGCSGSSNGVASTTSTTEVDFDVVTTLPADEQAVAAECDAQIREVAPALVASVFPENPGVQWSLVDLVTEGGLSFVEMEPAPADGLRPRYRLVVECHAASDPVLYGVYELDDETWTLLSTNDVIDGVELPEILG